MKWGGEGSDPRIEKVREQKGEKIGRIPAGGRARRKGFENEIGCKRRVGY